MAPADIPDDVWRFLTEKIDSVPHLEALLLLWEAAPQGFTVTAMAAQLYVPVERARDILRDLVQYKLVDVEHNSETHYRYRSEWDSDGQLMPAVVNAYRKHLISITSFIHSKASRAVREFARAFELKKDR